MSSQKYFLNGKGMHKEKVCRVCYIFWGNQADMKEHKHRAHSH